MQTFYPGDILDGHYRLLETLSTEGGTADVWLAIDLNTIDNNPLDEDDALAASTKELEETGLKVAIKIYRPKNALDIEGEQRFRDEFKIVFNCHHSNLIQPTHYSIWNGIPYLVLPFCAHGSSELLIGNLDPDHMWKYIGDVAGGLAYLHARRPPIVHQDIKPANVLIDDDFNYAITDFGISSTLGHRDLYDFASGTLAYMAPERFNEGMPPQPSSDVYAFGATLYELITGQIPFGENGGSAQPDGKVLLNYGDKRVPNDIKRLIAACLDKDPAKRPTAAEIEQAAQAQTFPLKSSHNKAVKWGLALAAIVAAAVIGATAWHMFKGAANPTATAEDPEKLYLHALSLADSNNPQEIQAGLEQMDSIAQRYNYVPAYYEIARTYGMVFVQDSTRYNKRKRALNIRLGNNDARRTLAQIGLPSDLDKDIPQEVKHNAKAINACFNLLNINDENSPREMTDAAWILGCYYMLCDKNKTEALKYFQQARQFATIGGDKETAEIAEQYIDVVTQFM